MNRRAGKKAHGDKKGDSMNVKEPMSKEEKAVVRWLRKNVPIKKTKFLNTHIVEYFIGSKAVDALINDSPWSVEKAKESSSLIFNTREDAINLMDELLKHKMFHRAKKIPVPEKTKKINNKKDDKSKEEKIEQSPQPGTDIKKKRKIRLDMHLDQIFLDSQDAFVWLYDPIPWYYWAGGTLIVLGIIGVCLFPLWPPILRRGVHYLSIVGVGFLIFIFALAAIQCILFGILFLLSGGKLRFWLLPNLTEDVGFFQSFVPLYDYTYTGESKKKKDKDSDDEESDDEEEGSDEKGKSDDSDDSTSKKSSTGKDFEIVNKNDTDLESDDNN
uniref:Translocation protein SEC62 n=1 Tax=Lepeophtheirus salmonis TaxID=72036 RepID=C1BVC9_LEPSM|nr:Translocation protein SEC62 [Lepeophtheirus salmonis]